jgi:hypothetical protein
MVEVKPAERRGGPPTVPAAAWRTSAGGSGGKAGRARYDMKLWMRDLKEGAAYLPK